MRNLETVGPPVSTWLVRGLKEREYPLRCAAVALRELQGSVPDEAPPRFASETLGLDAESKGAGVDAPWSSGVGTMALGKWPNAWGESRRRPADNALGGDLPPGRFWRFPHNALADLAVDRLVAARKAYWSGMAVLLFPGSPRRYSVSKTK